MYRFAAMVAGRRAAPKQEEDEKYLRIQLEEIVIVKDEAYDTLAAATAAAHARAAAAAANANGQFSTITTATPTGSASTSMENCARAAAAARGGVPTAARGVGFD